MTSGFSVCLSKVVFEMNKCTTLLHICTHQSSVKSSVRKKKTHLSTSTNIRPTINKHQQRSTSITSHHPTFPPKNWAAFMYSARKVSCAERPPRVEGRFIGRISGWICGCFCLLPRETLEEPYENLREPTC